MEPFHFIADIQHADEMSHRSAKHDYRYIIKLDNEPTVCRHAELPPGSITPKKNIMNSNLKIVSIKYKCL